MYIRHAYPNELYHHGILGQKWGIRRYQNPDGSLTPAGRKRYMKTINKAIKNPKNFDRVKMGFTEKRTIPEGTVMYRTSTAKNEQKKPGESTYVTYLEPERNLYKGGWVRQTNKADVAYEKTYTTKTDLNIPSRATCENEIKNLMKNAELRKEVLSGYLEIMFPKNSYRRDYDIYRNFGESIYENEKEYARAEKKWLTAKGKQIANDFKDMPLDEAAFTVQASLGLSPKTKDRLIKNLKNQGYNAMVDEASVGGRFNFAKEGIDPLIVFDSADLTPIKEETINKNDEGKYYSKYESFASKARRNNEAKWSEF